MAFSVIPKGNYCYEYVDDGDGVYYTRTCPYWGINKNEHKQENGYCSLLNVNDWDESLPMLWDQLKICGIKLND